MSNWLWSSCVALLAYIPEMIIIFGAQYPNFCEPQQNVRCISFKSCFFVVKIDVSNPQTTGMVNFLKLSEHEKAVVRKKKVLPLSGAQEGWLFWGVIDQRGAVSWGLSHSFKMLLSNCPPGFGRHELRTYHSAMILTSTYWRGGFLGCSLPVVEKCRHKFDVTRQLHVSFLKCWRYTMEEFRYNNEVDNFFDVITSDYN